MMRQRTEIQEQLYKHYFNLVKHVSNFNKWKVISQEGIWKLPIETQFGGKGYKWEDCLSALEGLVGSFYDSRFICKLVSHFLSLYLISKYSPESSKKTYLSILMRGKALFEIKSLSDVHLKKEINWLIKNRIILIEDVNIVSLDLINMKKIVFGILISHSALSLVNQYKKIKGLSVPIKITREKIKNCVNILNSMAICASKS